jgi:L-lysine 6-transaminase
MSMPPMLTEAASTSRPRLSKSKNKKAMDPSRVLSVLDEHILLDGFKIVIDLEKSRGSYLYDAATGRRLIDFYGFFGSMPVGFNHP